MQSLLNDPTLFSNQALIGGRWISPERGHAYSIKNPVNGEIIAYVPDLGAAATKEAVEAAHHAFQEWRSTSAGYRATLLRRWFDLLIENQEDLARILTVEQGKPIAESRGEIRYGASFIEWFSEEARRVYGDIIPGHEADKRILVLKQPVGVAGIITPWNFPNAMIARKVAPALAAGCTVVIKPAEATPLSAIAMALLAERAGFPPGVINLVTGQNPVPIGEALTSHPLVRKISFTGSTRVGKLLMAQCAGTMKRLSLELGGNAPFIVFDDADVDAAVEGAIASKYRNAGQTCVCANRFLVQHTVVEVFSKKLAEATARLRVGDGLQEGIAIGPLINKQALDKVERLVSDAVEKGATLVCGGKQPEQGGTFYEPTVMIGANASMALAKEEIFGPVAPIFPFETEAEAIELANHTEYGLAAYFYGKDIRRVFRVAEALEYGMVGVNTGMISNAVSPFGGIKESGFGREGGKYGIEEYLDMKYVCMAI